MGHTSLTATGMWPMHWADISFCRLVFVAGYGMYLDAGGARRRGDKLNNVGNHTDASNALADTYAEHWEQEGKHQQGHLLLFLRVRNVLGIGIMIHYVCL